MNKYRIVQTGDGKFCIQQKCLFFWMDVESAQTIEEAEKRIQDQARWAAPRKVIKEISIGD